VGTFNLSAKHFFTSSYAHLHIQNGGSKRIWFLTYSWTGNFLLAWVGQFSGIKNQTMHRFEQYLKILQLYYANSRFPPSFKFWSVSTIQKHWEKVKKCILPVFKTLKHFSYNPHSSWPKLTESFPFNYMLKSKFSLSRHFEYANKQITYHFWLWSN
jgi:hypothetical protein